jgi:hypothetical protein
MKAAKQHEYVVGKTMKLHWWIIGAAAVAAGGWLVVRRFLDNQNQTLHFEDENSEKNFGEFPPEIPESEFEGADFLA